MIHPRLCNAKPNFYPRSPCGERPLRRCPVILGRGISIHALLAESDLRVLDGSKSSVISIHALLAESDAAGRQNCYLDNIISIHALLAESDRQIKQTYRAETSISIHALLAESDIP